MKYPSHLLKLIEALKRLPGVGLRSAERFAFQLLDWKKEQLLEFADVVAKIPQHLHYCDECGCLIGNNGCPYCGTKTRDRSILCVVASVKDVFTMEQTGEYEGLYHVLGGLLSPLEGRGPDQLNLLNLRTRLSQNAVQELILALDSTLEGDATSLYLKREFESLPLKISRLAFGIPLGSGFDYIDGGTLARAFSDRGSF